MSRITSTSANEDVVAAGSGPAADGLTTPGSTTPGLKSAGSKAAGSKAAGSKAAGSTPGRVKGAGVRRVSAKGAPTIATPWGTATLVERVAVPQRVGERRFASAIELLERDDGERLIRVVYSTGGTARRGPVTLRLRDLERLRQAAAQTPELAHALGWGGDA